MSFQISIKTEELQKRSIFLACPMYGGMCAGIFTKSVADLINKCNQHGIQIMTFFLFNESLITRARNYCADTFMRSGATHFLFIDSDIGFNPDDVLSMLALQGDDSEYDILCGPYPKKCIAWEKIIAAVNKGVGEDNPNQLDDFVGDFVFNPLVEGPGPHEIPLGQPARVLESGTGFMMIRRKTFEDFQKAYPELSYRPDHVRTAEFDGSREIMMYFQAEVDPFTDSKRYLSEDYWFCQKVHAMGGKIWLCPWMRTQHLGSHIYGGSLAALASIGVSATADPTQLKKKKQK